LIDLTVNLHGKTALVTGGSAGIGRAIAQRLAQNGAAVAVSYYQTKDGAEETVTLIQDQGGKAFPVQADVSVKADVDRLVQEVAAGFDGRLDILINNAGDLIQRCPIADMTQELWDRVIDVNLKSVFLVGQAVLPIMKQRGYGRIVNMASVAGQDGGGMGAGHYAAAKAGVIAFTKSMAKEFARSGITVNALAPGLIATRYHDRYSTTEMRQRMVNNAPLAREGTPDDVAGAVLFLVSDSASYITGHTININGGLFLP
jgi:3-oxoacyl-[acyl-carrier protein] reductase